MALISPQGWFTRPDGRVIAGYAQHNGWWGGLEQPPGWWSEADTRPNITRRCDRIGPGWQEDLDGLTTAMVRYGYPGFEHNFGLWYDRRRDQHDTGPRTEGAPVPPLLEQPWARSGSGRAWDGGPLYDLSAYNPWYFERLRQFAGLCDKKGAVLFCNHYMQHALLETTAHYCDFPWRPVNCVQQTDLPDTTPAANAFYDLSHPLRRQLHKAYILHTLDQLARYRNVVHLVSEEYTGPVEFAKFWLDTIHEWRRRTGHTVTVGLGAPYNVQQAILADARYAAQVNVIDLRYWCYQKDGSRYAPKGGSEVPGRYAHNAAGDTTPEMVYKQVLEYRLRYPSKAIVSQFEATTEQTWAFFLAGGSMLIRRLSWLDPATEKPIRPTGYVAPPAASVIQPLYRLMTGPLSTHLAHMKPIHSADGVWTLASNKAALSLARPGVTQITPEVLNSRGRATWMHVASGATRDAGTVPKGKRQPMSVPSDYRVLLVSP